MAVAVAAADTTKQSSLRKQREVRNFDFHIFQSFPKVHKTNKLSIL